MTGAPRRVASKGALRLAAWSSAAAALVASWGVFGALPKPIAAATVLQTRPQKIVVVRQVLRRVIVQEAAPATPPTTVTFTPASGSSAPPAPTSTGGSAP
ncbi:MAG TPA: hypothetical protein VF036_04680 [Actinomycetota bacterium]|jgi:hypothetical protein